MHLEPRDIKRTKLWRCRGSVGSYACANSAQTGDSRRWLNHYGGTRNFGMVVTNNLIFATQRAASPNKASRGLYQIPKTVVKTRTVIFGLRR